MSPPIFIRTPNNTNDNTLPTFDSDDNTSISSPTHLQIGIIIALIIAGLAILGCTATCIIKRRRRAVKKAAKAVKLGPLRERECEGYGYEWDDVVILGDAGGNRDREGQERGEVEQPPRYSVVVAGDDGDGEGKGGRAEGI